MTFEVKMQVTLPQVFFKHFAGKNQLPGLSVSGTLVENGLKLSIQAKTLKPASLRKVALKI